MSVQKQQETNPESIKDLVLKRITQLCASSQTFEHAYDTYTQQYGKDIISPNDPLNLVDTIDSVIIILGKNTPIYYSDSRKTLHGSLGSLELKVGSIYIIGRRQPQDSILVAWGPDGQEVELERYNPEAGIIPSRIHGAVYFEDDQKVLYTDLTSSSGTVIVGDQRRRGAFICVYDPGSVEFPAVKLDWISTER